MLKPHLISFMALLFSSLAILLSATAQDRGAGDLMSAEKLRSIGLDSAWHVQVEFDATRGHLAGIGMHINHESPQYIVQIKHPSGRMVISEHDLSPLGKEIGIKGAKKKGEQWIIDWKLRNPKSKEPEPVLEELEVPDVFLVAAAERGMVQGFNGETGFSPWVTKVGSERLPTLTPGVNYNQVAVINGSKLYVLNKSDGKVVWETKTDNPPGGGPAMSNQYLFVPMVNGMVETYDLVKYRRPPNNFRSFGRIFTSAVVFKDAVAWTTDQGNVYVANSEAPGIRYRVSARDDVNTGTKALIKASTKFTPGPPTFLYGGENVPSKFYFGTAEGYVFCCEADRGGILSRLSAGEPVSQTPVVVKDHVYAITENDNLFCMDSTSMSERWLVSGIRQFLSGSEERVYVMDSYHNLVALDAKTGSRIGSVPMGNIDFVYTNTLSDRIYLGTKAGVLQCLHEVNRHYPWVHSGTVVKKKFEQILNNQNQAEDAPADEPKAEMKDDAKDKPADDPFGAAAPAMKEEKPAAVPVGDDPFK